MLDLADPVQNGQYWDYSFHNEGLEDVPAFVDSIIAARPGACNKVTIVAHSTAVNSSLVAASRIPKLADKVGMITGLGPCL